MSTDQAGVAEAVTETMMAVQTIAHALHVGDARLEPTLDAIVANAAAAHPAASDAGIILLVHGELVPQAVTGRPPLDLDVRQRDTGEGPCLDAAKKQTVMCISDTSTEQRWPGFCTAAQAHGVRSMLCVPLRIGEQCLGTLTLFSHQVAAFGPPDVALVELFAALAALSLADAQRAGQLREAIASRDLIGQAKGILMERFKISEQDAFGRLSRASQALNLKLAEVARHLTETGELLGPGPSAT